VSFVVRGYRCDALHLHLATDSEKRDSVTA
jgi:hypothetical protein